MSTTRCTFLLCAVYLFFPTGFQNCLCQQLSLAITAALVHYKAVSLSRSHSITAILPSSSITVLELEVILKFRPGVALLATYSLCHLGGNQ